MFFFVISFVLSLALGCLALRVFPLLGLLDNPKKYGHTRDPIPYFGGLVLFFSIVPLALILLPLSRPLAALLAGAVCITLVSFVDDARGLPPLLRLGAQVLAGSILVAGGIGISSLTNPLGGVLDLTTLSVAVPLVGEYHVYLLADLLTIAWVVLLMNAMNWLDGIPGLSTGLGGLAALVIFFLAQRPDFHFFDQSVVLALSAIVAGAALAFLLFNSPPAKILLGDTGSMLLGFLLAGLSIYSGGKIATAALVLALPILDALFVVAWRVLRARAPWRGGEWDGEGTPVHMHHRLLAAGASERQILLLFLGVAALFGLLALQVPTTWGKLLAFAGVGVGLLVLQQVLPQQKKKLTKSPTSRQGF